MEKVRIAYIGLGGRGYGLLHSCLVKMKDVEIVAVCDNYEDRAQKGANLVAKTMGNTPFVTTDYNTIIGLPTVNCVFIATAWEDHIKVAIQAMKLGKFVALEVGGAYKIEDCHELIKTYEETGVHCMMLENCNYGEYELMTLNMVRQGIMGDVVHCEGGYCHDLRYEICNGEKNRHYRLRNYMSRNCENYPTHELGPIAKILDINNGNRIVSLTSISSNARGLKAYIDKKSPKHDDLKDVEFQQGDIVTTILQCSQGQTITLTLDTTLPRIYSRKFTIHGTKALYQEDGNMVIIDGKENLIERPQKWYWNNAKKYAGKYAHPLWDRKNRKYRKYGHGGMDWFVLRAMVETVKAGSYPPIDVYDTALWMAITPLSEKSIAQGGVKIEVPNFAANKVNNNHNILPQFRLDK